MKIIFPEYCKINFSRKFKSFFKKEKKKKKRKLKKIIFKIKIKYFQNNSLQINVFEIHEISEFRVFVDFYA